LSPELIVTLTAILKSGGAYLYLNPAEPAEQRARIAPDAGAQFDTVVRIDATRSRLTLVKPDAKAQSLTLIKDAPADTLASQVQSLVPGEYRIRWQVLASDGHITRGEIPFQVTRP